MSTDNAGTDFDTQISVYTGDCLASGGALDCVDGNDDIDPGVNSASRVAFESVVGQDYLILVHGLVAKQATTN